MDADLQVHGLRELRRELRRISTELPKEVKRINIEVAERIVLPEARRRGAASRLNVAGGQARLGSRGVATIKATRQQGKAGVQLGGARVPWGPGSEWGSTGRNPRARMFPRRSGVSKGFILYPAVREKEPEIREAYAEMMDDLLKQAFPE
jgi:hypothetical protein